MRQGRHHAGRTCGFVLAAALSGAALRADIRATTTIRCYVKDVPTPCTGPLREGGVVAGSNADGTFLEAMIDAAQTLNAIKNAVQAVIAQNFPAAAQELKKAYDEAVELQQSGADKTSVQKAYVRLDQAAPYTRVTLTFDASSDDDPFRDLRVAAPRVRYTLPGNGTGDDGGPVPTMGATLDAVVIEQIQGGRGSRSGRAVVTLYPKRMPQGAFYPVLFSTKETDCSICLGILHDIEVSTYKTCAQVLILGTYCETKGREFYANVDVSNWGRSVVVDSYNKMQQDVAREVQAGRRDEAIKRLHDFKAETGEMNARLRSAPVEERLYAVDQLEDAVAGAFEGPDQAKRQNELSKSTSAQAVDGRRAGAKK